MPDGSFPPFSDAEPTSSAREAAPRGAAPVARMTDLPALEAGAVLYLRLWLGGETDRARALADFTALLGLGHGAATAECFDRLCGLILAHGRRPLMRHACSCGCVGGDEAVFAGFIARAAEGEREEAMLIASLLLRADFAPLAVAMAEELAAALKRMALRAGPPTRRAGARQAAASRTEATFH